MSHVHLTITHAVVVETELLYSLPDLGRACGTSAELIEALVHEGVLAPAGDGPASWQFPGSQLPRARRATRLIRDLELSTAGAALVLDLLGEIESLRSRLRRQAGHAI